MSPPSLEVLVTPTCPHAEPTMALVERVGAGLAPEWPIKRTVIRSLAQAREGAFRGSPTVLVGGVDIEPGPGAPAFACRLYDGSGVPPGWRIEAAVLRSIAPGHLLFLCVANSARSQMAEGIARSLAPGGTRISSAGSEPSRVRPEAVAVLDEIGLDIRGHRSKGLDEVPRPVEAVVTLCAEEVCPAWLESSLRVHWGLPDPAGAGRTAEEELEAFRATRDELARRIALLF